MSAYLQVCVYMCVCLLEHMINCRRPKCLWQWALERSS